MKQLRICRYITTMRHLYLLKNKYMLSAVYYIHITHDLQKQIKLRLILQMREYQTAF